MKIFSSLILISFFIFLSSCSRPENVGETESQELKKQDFFINTTLGADFVSGPSFKKTGKITSQKDIVLNSQASGRVANVLVKAGDSVRKGQPLINMSDTVASYGISLQRASLGIERAKINYDSSKLSLDKAVQDSEITVSQLQRNLVALKSDSEKNIALAQDNLQNTQNSGLDSRVSLQIEQLDNNIEKSKLDFEIKKTSDEEQVTAYGATIKKDFNAMIILLTDIVQFSDEILGVTDINKDINNRYQDFLGAQDKGQLRESEIQLQKLIDVQASLKLQSYKNLLKGDLQEDQYIELINYINGVYDESKDLLNDLEVTLNNSIRSQGSLGDTELAAFLGELNGYQASLQGNYGGFLSFGSSVKSFLRTYKANQASIEKSIALQVQDKELQLKALSSSEFSAETGLERTKISTQDNIENLEDQLKSAQINLETAKKNRDVSLRSLNNAIDEAQVSYTSSLREYQKLSVASPISGVVTEIYVDIGQEVGQGMQMIKIVSNSDPIIDLTFNSQESAQVSIGDSVKIMLDEKEYSGKIYSLSEVADANLNYKAEISVGKNLSKEIGRLVSVVVPTETSSMLIPLNIIEAQGEEIGLVNIYKDGSISQVRVRMGESYDNYVEIVSCAQDCEGLNIVTSDISNYDQNTFKIIEK